MHKDLQRERLALDTIEQCITISKVSLANDQCFESFMGEFFYLSKEILRNFMVPFINIFQMQKIVLVEV